ncbi:rhomboid family intramembrane serine protease [Chamaesiphon polymorphus]|nr:rhomboid family intramembrane serine protease [Chamaesiphon polymorphus]
MTKTANRNITKIQILGALVALAWGVTTLDIYFYHHELLQFGILPRDPIGLRGILFAPFLHSNYTHLIVDTIPFVALGWLIMEQAIANFTIVSLICLVLGGSSAWIVGPAADSSFVYFIGAAPLINGYISYLFALYYFDRRLWSSAFEALAIGCAYWIVRTNLPAIELAIWPGSILCGCVGGIWAARLVYRK